MYFFEACYYVIAKVVLFCKKTFPAISSNSQALSVEVYNRFSCILLANNCLYLNIKDSVRHSQT